mgnify:CR=1 FL=1
MPFIVGPSKNPTTALALAGLRAADKKKPQPQAEPTPARAALATAEKKAAKHVPKKAAAKKARAK